MRFEIQHEFDAPLDAIELAVISPDLGALLARSLPKMAAVETIEHRIEDGACHRVIRFQASAPLAIFERARVAREAMAWEEHWTYRLRDHASSWVVEPRPEYRKYLISEGTYRLEALPDGRTRRIVNGTIGIQVAMVGAIAERMAVAEIRKTYDAEADTLRRLATS